MNVIARLEFELSNYNVAVHHSSNYTKYELNTLVMVDRHYTMNVELNKKMINKEIYG